MEDKIIINNLINKQIISKFENSFIGIGKSYSDLNGKINFNAELDNFLDPATKNMILTQCKSKLNYSIPIYI